MSQERVSEIQKEMHDLKRRMRPLEWDLGRNQINPFRKQMLEKMQAQHASLEQEMNALQGN